MNVRLLVQVLGAAGHHVDLLVFPTGRDVELRNVKIIRLPNIFRVHQISAGPSLTKLGMDVLMTLVAFWLCLFRKYDVIHGIEEGGFLAVVLSRLFGKASIFDMDSCISDQLKYSGFITNPRLLKHIRHLEGWAIRHSSVVVTVCSALSEKARCLAPKANIVQIEDIPSPGIKKFDRQMVEILINTYKLRHDRRVVYTGNLERYQGIDLLLAAWKVFMSEKKNGKPYKLVIVGGPTEKVDYYKKTVDKDSIANSVCFVGPRPLNEMGAWMALSDVLVSPRSEGDNTPLKIYSYMSSGRPIVATRRRTHTQVLDDSMAFLAEPDPVQFAAAISEALTDGNVATKRSGMAKQMVEDQYSYNTFSKKLLEAYNSIRV
ncbi:MAG: glycosyltransferase [Proteobacteria bacterium]|nr:glycosyltransferase [Pseudomonadota bacterium]